MSTAIGVQYGFDAEGKPTGVFFPINFWRETALERETASLLESEPMNRRLLAAKERQRGCRLRMSMKNLEFSLDDF